jgi:hypothetical protein
MEHSQVRWHTSCRALSCLRSTSTINKHEIELNPTTSQHTNTLITSLKSYSHARPHTYTSRKAYAHIKQPESENLVGLQHGYFLPRSVSTTPLISSWPEGQVQLPSPAIPLAVAQNSSSMISLLPYGAPHLHVHAVHRACVREWVYVDLYVHTSRFSHKRSIFGHNPTSGNATDPP